MSLGRKRKKRFPSVLGTSSNRVSNRRNRPILAIAFKKGPIFRICALFVLVLVLVAGGKALLGHQMSRATMAKAVPIIESRSSEIPHTENPDPNFKEAASSGKEHSGCPFGGLKNDGKKITCDFSSAVVDVEATGVQAAVASNGTVNTFQKISSTTGGFVGNALDDSDGFGFWASSLGDLDNDGVVDLIVGAARDDDGGIDRGAVYILFMNANGSVKSSQKISSTAGGFAGALDDSDFFGESVAGLGDLDGDGVEDAAVGAVGDDDGGVDRGAIWILFLNANGTVKGFQKISDTQGGFTGIITQADNFGAALTSLGDLDNDGVIDIAAGVQEEDDGGPNRGGVWILFLNANGTVKGFQKISDTDGGFTGVLDDQDRFGVSVVGLLDLDGDAVEDLAVGALNDDDGGTNRGAVWILFLNASGTVKAHQKISDTDGNFLGVLVNEDGFGGGLARIGDLDNDGVADLAAGAGGDDDGGVDRGAVWILFMNANGTVKGFQKVSDTQGNFTALFDDFDAVTAAAGFGADFDGDGIEDLVFRSRGDDDGGTGRGAIYMVFMNANGTVKSFRKISDTQGGFATTGVLANSDRFGFHTTSLGDLDGDGVTDLAVGVQLGDGGVPDEGAVYILLMNTNGTVKHNQRIAENVGGFTGALDANDFFGGAVASLGDLDNDGVNDLAVGAQLDDDGGLNRGAIYILFLNRNGTVKSFQKISSTTGGFVGPLDNVDALGRGLGGLGDFDGDGVEDLAVGAEGDDDGGGPSRGAVWLLFLNVNGTVKAQAKISQTAGGFGGVLGSDDGFGTSIARIGDLDNDGVNDLAVGANGNDGGVDRGEVWIIFMNANGTVKGQQKISNTSGNFTAVLDNLDNFGNQNAIAALGDLDEDGIEDIAVSALQDDDGGTDRGAVYIIFLNINGTVKSFQKISNTQGNFTGVLDNADIFGVGPSTFSDLNGDGVIDLVVGSILDDDGGADRGALYVLFLAVGNTAPVVGFTADNVIPVAQVSQATNGTGVVTISFKVRDAETNNVTLKDFAFSTDGGATFTAPTNGDASAAFGGGWPNNAGAGYSSATTFGAATTHNFTINTKHADLATLNNIDGNVIFRFKANDGTVDSAFGVTDVFALDNKSPEVLLAPELVERPISGGTVLIRARFTETNPGTNTFSAERNNAGFGPEAAGQAGSATPTPQATEVGSNVDGDDVVTQIRVKHVDALGNETIINSLPNQAVRPLLPPVPTVTPLSVSDTRVVINQNAGELGGVQYAIAFISTVTEFVQADNILGPNPIFRSFNDWGGANGITVTGLQTGRAYTVRVRARNPNGDQPRTGFSGNRLAFLRSWGTLGNAAGQFTTPGAVAVRGNDVYAADSANNRIQKFDVLGNFVRQWGAVGNGPGQFVGPNGVAVDGTGNFVYVTDLDNHRIQKFDRDGNFLLQWGTQGNGNLQFQSPRGIAVDTLGNVLVADTGNNRIQKFDANGNFLTNWGTQGSGNSQFDGPRFVATDSANNVYVADTNNNRIQKFDANGNFLLAWGSPGAGDSQFNGPSGIAVDASDDVFVAELNNTRTQKFNSDGAFINKFGEAGVGNGQFIAPEGIASGTVFITDSGNNRIQVLSDDSDVRYTQPSGGGGAPQAPQLPPPGIPAAPTTGVGEAVGVDKIRWNFTDKSDNEDGFKIKVDTQTVAQNAQANLSFVEETGLATNTQYANRVPCAFNISGDGCSTRKHDPVYTQINQPTGLEFANVNTTSVTVSAKGEFPNLDQGNSGLFFENVTDTVAGASVQRAFRFAQAGPTLNSGWIKETSFKFENLEPNKEYTFRVKARNGDAVETDWTIDTVTTAAPGAPELTLNLTVGINTGVVAVANEKVLAHWAQFVPAVKAASQDTRKELLAREITRNDGIVRVRLQSGEVLEFEEAEFSIEKNVYRDIKAVSGFNWSLESLFVIANSLSSAVTFSLIFFVLAALVSMYRIGQNYGRRPGVVSALPVLLFRDPQESFEHLARRTEKGTYQIEYSKHKYYQKYLAASFMASLLLVIVKAALVTAIALYGEPTVAQSPFVDDGKEVKRQDELIYRLDFVNAGGSATNSVITASVPPLTTFVSGSMSVNGVIQTDRGDGDAGEFIGGVVRFRVGQINRDTPGYVLYRVRVAGDPESDTVITNQGRLTYVESAAAVLSNNTRNPIKAVAIPEEEEEEVTEEEVPLPPAPPPPPAAPVAPGVPSAPPAPPEEEEEVEAVPTEGETQVSTVENQFNVTFIPPAEKEEPELSTTGSFQVTEEEVTFSGTTNEPETAVVLQMNGQTVTTISDAQGNWVILVRRALFGVTEEVTVRAQIVKGERVSKLVDIARISLVKPAVVEIEEVLPPPIVPEPVQRVAVAAVQAARAVQAIAKEAETETQVAAVAIVPIVTAVNPTIALNLPHTGQFVYHFFSWLMSVLGIRRRRKPWGTVYDSITKEPLSLAIVRLFKVGEVPAGVMPAGRVEAVSALAEGDMPEITFAQAPLAPAPPTTMPGTLPPAPTAPPPAPPTAPPTGLPGVPPVTAPQLQPTPKPGEVVTAKLLETQVTDRAGRFGFLPSIGKFKIEITKPDYSYPSYIVTTPADAEYEQVYRSEEFTITRPDQLITVSVPLDPVNKALQAQKAKARGAAANLWYKIREAAEKSSFVLITIGFVATFIVTLSSLTILNITIFGLYTLFAIFQILFQPKKIKPWGRVYDTRTLQPIPLAVVSILDVEYNKLLKTRLTDYQGRFNFLPPAGKYQIRVEKEGYRFPSEKREIKMPPYENNYFGGAFEVTKDKEIVDIDVPVDPV